MIQRSTITQMPDPHDRTPNEPSILLEPKDVKAIYENILNPVTPMYDYEPLIRTVLDVANQCGWSKFTVMGKQILLTADVRLVEEGKTE